MSDEPTALVTNDAAMHRAFRKVEPFVLDPWDVELMEGKTVMSTEQMIAYVVQDMAEHPEKHPVPPGVEWADGAAAHLRELAAKAPTEFLWLKTTVEPQIGHDEARIAWELRVVEGFSWRAVAAWFAESALVVWPGENNSQPAGMAICAVAAELLNQDFEQEPWNVFPA